MRVNENLYWSNAYNKNGKKYSIDQQQNYVCLTKSLNRKDGNLMMIIFCTEYTDVSVGVGE